MVVTTIIVVRQYLPLDRSFKHLVPSLVLHLWNTLAELFDTFNLLQELQHASSKIQGLRGHPKLQKFSQKTIVRNTYFRNAWQQNLKKAQAVSIEDKVNTDEKQILRTV